MRRLLTALAFAACAALVAPAARAGDYDDALRSGVEARDRARETQYVTDWQAAFAHFERAVALEDTAIARFELAEAAAALGRVDIAYESHELALARGVSGKAATIARAYLDAHAADVALIELLAPAGTRVWVDGRERGRLPLERPLLVRAGRVHVQLVAPGASPWESTLELEPRVVHRLAPELASSEPAPKAQGPVAPSSGRSSVGSESAAAAPVSGVAGAEDEESSWLGERPAAIALLSVAGVALAVGGGFAWVARGQHQEADDARSQIEGAFEGHVENGVFSPAAVPCGPDGIASGVVGFGPGVGQLQQQTLVEQYANACAEFHDRSVVADRSTRLATIGLGVGLVASAAVLTWYIATPSHDAPGADRASVAVTPILSADTQGLLFDISF
ncbi:MAG TPA: hypothetical protein VNN80_36300 [Polyangiaceae bacterium]|nr:hypothetical protein [Polyangiaceae bacterium]